MAVEYKFDKQLYMHGACQYFAIQAAEMFNGKVCLPCIYAGDSLLVDIYVNLKQSAVLKSAADFLFLKNSNVLYKTYKKH